MTRAQPLLYARAAHGPPALVVTAIATALAVGSGRGWSSLWVCAAVLAGQLSVGWSNDYFDRDLDRAAGRRDKPLATGELAPSTVRRAAVAALVACAALSAASGWRAATVHLVAVTTAWAYNGGLKRTLWSFAPYAVAFGLLPAFISLGARPARWPPLWALAAGAALGVGAHFLNVVPDLTADRHHGVWGLPQRAGLHVSLRVGAACIVAASALLVAFGSVRAGPALLAVNSVLAGGALALGASRRPRLAWYVALAAAVVLAALFAASGSDLS